MPRSAKPKQTQPIRVPQNLPYGQGKEMAAQMRAVPLPGPGATGAGQPPTGGAGPMAGTQLESQIDPDQLALSHAQQMSPPAITGLSAPSQNPNEPVTNGLAIGAGAGPEALGVTQPPSVASMLDRLGQSSSDPLLAGLSAMAKANGV